MRRPQLADAVHERVHRHIWAGIALFVAIGALTLWRWSFFRDPVSPLSPVYLDFSFLAAALAGFQGWLGGELVYTHGVFVAPPEAEGAAPASRKKPAARGSHHQH